MKARAPAAPAPAAERAPAPPACVPVHLQALPDIPKSRLSCAPLLWHIPREALRASFLAAPSGPVLTPRVLDRMEELKETNVFFALQPGQVDLELLEELRFTWGF